MKYMAALVTVRTPDPAVLPAELERARALTEQGVLVAGYIAHDRQRGWMVVEAESQEAAREAIESLPFARYWSIEITALAEP